LHILWITGRRIESDLAGTTELGLANGLAKHGNKIHLISPDSKKNDSFWKHTLLKRIDIKGLETWSGGRDAKRIIQSQRRILSQIDMMLVDWRFINSLAPVLKAVKIPWCIIDRGPPAYRGLLSKIQKISWKRAWKFASKNAKGGIVVSPGHKKYIESKVGIKMDLIVVPAGTNTGYFSKNKKIPEEKLNFVYAGRVDKNRGIDEMIRLLDDSKKLSIRSKLTVIGAGDYVREFKKLSIYRDDLEVLGKIPREEVWNILEKSHVGIMPMPDMPIWRIASPIKLAEYAAAGLLVIGPEHRGNKLNEGRWSILSDESPWSMRCLERLEGILESGEWGEISDVARVDSLQLDWNNISSRLEEKLIYWIG